MKNYIAKIRSKIGSDKFIHPGARIIIENDQQEILVIERTDNDRIGLPAGALEEGESIEECIIREVKEETGLTLLHLEVIGISSNPDIETVQYPNGDKIQYFTTEFYSNKWQGKLHAIDSKEVKKAKFIDLQSIVDLPPNELSAFRSLQHYRDTKKILLK